MNEVSFDKYAVKGAYHWTEYFGPVHRINAYTRTRYHNILAGLRRHGISRNHRVLDVGCGDGALAGLFALKLRAKISGVDTTPLSIDLARQEFIRRGLASDFRLVEDYRYPYIDGTFDAVICSEVIEHVRQPELLLAEMWRVLSPGGILIITTPIRYTEAPLDRLHVKEWFPDEFRRLCEQTLCVPVNLCVTHPIALLEIYASSSPILGRFSRLFINILSKLGFEVFQRTNGFRAFSTQMAIAKKY